jgi:peptidoglycan/LPS O-acetylase OafA/YrhL
MDQGIASLKNDGSELVKPKEFDSNYFYSINFLRGLAALAVCWRHLCVGNIHYLSPDNTFNIAGQYGWVGVQIFFIISGFVIPYSMYYSKYSWNNFGQFFLKRCIRIEPPYIIAMLLVIIITFLSTLFPMHRGPEFTFNWMGFLLHFGYLNAFFNYDWLNPVFWTLSIEFQFYLIVALIFPFIINPNKYIRYFSLIFLGSISFIISDEKYFFYHSSLFIIGIIIFYYKISFLEIKDLLIPIVILLLCVFFQMGREHFFASLFTICILTFLNINWSISNFLGKISFSLYLIHIPIGLRVVNLSESYITNEAGRVFIVILAILISIAFATVFFYVVEQPFLLYSKRIKYRKEALEPGLKPI